MAPGQERPEIRDEEPPLKRQRTALACYSCRSRKTKCDGARPACDVCVSMGFDCVYKTPVRNSTAYGFQTESITRLENRLLALEDLLGSVVSKVGMAVSAANGPLQHDTPPHSRASLPRDERTEPREDVNVAELPLASNAVDDTVDGMGVITFADEFTSRFFGATSNSAFCNHISRALGQVRSFDQRDDPTQINGVDSNFISRPPSPHALVRGKLGSTPQVESVDSSVLPSETRIIQLVDLFFAEFGMLFPYIYKKTVLDGLVEFKTANFHHVRRSWLCLLNTIMAFATSLTLPDPQKQNETAKADVYLHRAFKSLPNTSLKPANLETLQALLLLTQYLQGTQRSAQTWNFQGLATQVAFQIGAHCPSALAGESPLEREIRKRCWCMCFILDKTCSMTFGMPPSIPSDYIQDQMPQDVYLEALDESIGQTRVVDSVQGPSTVAAYGHSVDLYRIAGNVISKLYQNNIGADQCLSVALLFQRVVSCEGDLMEWRAHLPPSLGVKSKAEIFQGLEDTTDFFRLSTVLTLRYLNVRLLIHRAMLARLLDHDNKVEANYAGAFLQQFGQNSLELSAASATEMIDIIYTMSKAQHRMLTSWWFSMYYVFNSALVVFAVLVVQHRQCAPSHLISAEQFTSIFSQALEALELLGQGTRMALRCRKYLKKLAYNITSIGLLPTGPFGVALDAQNQAFDGFSLNMSDLSEFSPLDMDIGPWMATDSWNNFV